MVLIKEDFQTLDLQITAISGKFSKGQSFTLATDFKNWAVKISILKLRNKRLSYYTILILHKVFVSILRIPYYL